MKDNGEMSLLHPVWRKLIKLEILGKKKRNSLIDFLEIENSETTNSLQVMINSFTFAKCDQHFWAHNIRFDYCLQKYN